MGGPGKGPDRAWKGSDWNSGANWNSGADWNSGRNDGPYGKGSNDKGKRDGGKDSNKGGKEDRGHDKNAGKGWNDNEAGYRNERADKAGKGWNDGKPDMSAGKNTGKSGWDDGYSKGWGGYDDGWNKNDAATSSSNQGYGPKGGKNDEFSYVGSNFKNDYGSKDRGKGSFNDGRREQANGGYNDAKGKGSFDQNRSWYDGGAKGANFSDDGAKGKGKGSGYLEPQRSSYTPQIPRNVAGGAAAQTPLNTKAPIRAPAVHGALAINRPGARIPAKKFDHADPNCPLTEQMMRTLRDAIATVNPEELDKKQNQSVNSLPAPLQLILQHAKSIHATGGPIGRGIKWVCATPVA